MFYFQIDNDPIPVNPREFDNLTTMVCFHKRYNLPLEADFDSDDYSSWAELEQAIIEAEHPVLIKPLYMYDHSMQDIATSYRPYWYHAQWDAGQIGFVYVTKKSQEYMGTPDDRLEAVLEAEVDEFVAYIQGDVWGYVILDENNEEVDSCFGYFGYDAAREGAQAIVDHLNAEEYDRKYAETMEIPGD